MKARKVKGLDPGGALAENARRIVAVRLEELRSFVPHALDAGQGDALHDMRIAAKRLRYVLEVTEPALGPAAADGAQTAREIQDLLGEIHDCDVMLPRVRAHTDRLRAEDAEWVAQAAGGRAQEVAGTVAQAPNRARYCGLETLATYLAARRSVLFERFVRQWEALEQSGYATGLLEQISRPAPAPAAPSGAGGP